MNKPQHDSSSLLLLYLIIIKVQVYFVHIKRLVDIFSHLIIGAEILSILACIDLLQLF